MKRFSITVCVILGLSGHFMFAQESLLSTPDEEEALELFDGRKLVKAREKAQKILEKNPESIIGLYVMSKVYHELDVNHARALYLVRKARDILNSKYGERPTDIFAQEWHKKLLKHEILILAEMDRREEELEILRYYDTIYTPSMEVYQMWPLMKLGRFEEAIEIGKRYTYSTNMDDRQRAYNSLMAVACEQRERQASYDWGYEGFFATEEKSCTIATNLALASLQSLKFSEIEMWVRKAKNAPEQDCANNPLEHLVKFYLLQGEFQKCISAIKQLRKEPLERTMRVQFEKGNRARVAELFYALGMPEEAEKRAIQAVLTPDRAGMTSSSKESIAFSNITLHYATLMGMVERLREKAEVRSFVKSLPFVLQAAQHMLTAWTRKRTAMGLGVKLNIIIDAIRPYILDNQDWYVPILYEMLGTGAFAKAIARAREVDGKFGLQISAYFDAYEGEVEWYLGNYEKALVLGESAIARLPNETKLLRWRVITWMADANYQIGNLVDANKYYDEVLKRFPTLIRYLHIRLPVIFYKKEGEEFSAVVEMLRRSPRFKHVSDSMFVVSVDGKEDDIEICLKSQQGFQYVCVQESMIKSNGQEDSEDKGEERFARIVDDFHEKAFSPKVELSSEDINSLDGRTARVRSEDAVKEILGGEEEEKEMKWEELE